MHDLNTPTSKQTLLLCNQPASHLELE